jgi:superfamily II DNA or RNA helicase
MVKEADCPARVVAHRGELVLQLSLSLNQDGVPHGIDAPAPLVAEICRAHHDEHGRSFYKPRAQVRVASVQTLASRGEDASAAERVRLLVVDEGHHVVVGNIWSKVVQMYANAKCLFPTAHAIRGDSKGLGRDAHGLADALVQGPCFRDLIEQGYLCDYRPIVGRNTVDTSSVPVGTTGDFNQKKLRVATAASKQIVGDVVSHYVKFAGGKLGITFCVSIEEAEKIQQAYSRADVRAEIITGETPTGVRTKIMRKFRERDILQLLSIDVLGEGVNVPSVEVISMARSTASFQVFAQQTGRGSRVSVGKDWQAVWDDIGPEGRKAAIAASDKPKFVLIDHVGNVEHHGLPCVPRRYSLDTREVTRKKKAEDEVQIRVCLNAECLLPYPRELDCCPLCGTVKPPPVARSAPEFVDGNLFELDPEVLAGMREAAMRALDLPTLPVHAGPAAVAGCKARHREKVDAIVALKDTMALWAGWQRTLGLNDGEAMSRFWLRYGVTVLQAQCVTRAAADDLRERIESDLSSHHVVKAE